MSGRGERVLHSQDNSEEPFSQAGWFWFVWFPTRNEITKSLDWFFFPLYDSSQRFHPSFHLFWHLNLHYLSPLNNYYNSAFTPYRQLGELLKIYQVNITYCYKWSQLDHGTQHSVFPVQTSRQMTRWSVKVWLLSILFYLMYSFP